MTESSEYDAIVIGAGPGGATAAKAASLRGMRVALVSDDHLLGYGLEGAYKSKALWEMARDYYLVRSRFGHSCADLPIDFAELAQGQREGAESLRKMHRRQFAALGVDVVEGRGRFVDPHTVSVGDRLLKGRFVIVATGTRPRVLNGMTADGQAVMTSDHVVALPEAPGSMLVLGAGVIGCEFASIFAALGVDVTLLDSRDRILAHEDEDISRLLTRSFAKLQVRVRPNARCSSMERTDAGVRTVLDDGTELLTDTALLAVGRTANTSDLGLDHAGVATDRYGYIPVDDNMRTDVPHIYAVGDVGLRATSLDLSLVHVAEAEARRAVDHIAGEAAPMETNHVPFIIFTMPTVAGAGDNEHHARERYGAVRVGKFANIRNHRAHAKGSRAGFVKLIVGPPGDDRVLGARGIGDGVESIVGEVSLMVQKEMPYTDLLHAIHAHPSLDESLHGAAQIIRLGALPYEEGEDHVDDFWIAPA